jgi:hypothetical protein
MARFRPADDALQPSAAMYGRKPVDAKKIAG